MGRSFDIEYDDFSGGYYVGPSDAKQPQNTWKGDDLCATPNEGFLVPTPTTLETATWAAGSTALPARPLEDQFGQIHTFRSGVTNIEKISWAGSTMSASTQAIGSANTFSSVSNGAGAVWDKYVFWGTNTTFIVYSVTGAAPAAARVATPDVFNTVGGYRSWAIGGATNRIYYSNPYDITTWSASNYYQVGSSQSNITGLIELNDGLYIATTTGWWVGTGVPGATFTLRQITTTPVLPFSQAIIGGGIVYPTPESFSSTHLSPEQLTALSGSRESPLLFNANGGLTSGITLRVVEAANIGNAAAFLCVTGTLWIFDPARGNGWQRRTALMPYFSGGGVRLVHGRYGYNASLGHGFAAGLVTSPSNNLLAIRYRLHHEHPEPQYGTSTFPTATATLADYRQHTRFTVDEVLVEVDLGSTSTNGTRSVGVQIKTPGILLESGATPSISAASSDLQTRTLPAATTTNRERLWLTFRPNVSQTYAVEPNVTLQGVKLCRLILRCKEV